ncbi:hypothetical protein FKR81_14455 [Lentzea tibetensis]|uniref:Uncharacterized protein n=1 Tax=Lentzea tibetensis TaxID=2591470 RepID=A0A563EUS0_9PSEU|nr:hypothetical protein [Lentzea tibetensis]TWP51419.1 hypothetical protein FKR81_14455 [Lentzea tibetensis]
MTFVLLALVLLVAPTRPSAITRLRKRNNDLPRAWAECSAPFQQAVSWDLLAVCPRASLWTTRITTQAVLS